MTTAHIAPLGGRWIALALLGVACAGCAEADDTARAERVHALMMNDLEPAADLIWESAGWVVTEAGEQELWPTTDAGWAAVAAGADRVAGLGRTLATADYAADTADWTEIAGGLTVAANRARRAAETHDKDELFDAGGHLYRVCVACHRRYMIEPAP